jgi:hypothetical protein
MLQEMLKGLSIVVLLAMLGACATPVEKTEPEPAADAAAEAPMESAPGTMMIFVDREAGSDQPFTTRIFVNPGFMHISDSRSPEDFILFDRKTQTIHSVTMADKTVFDIGPKPVTIDPPIAIKYEEESQPSSAIPKIDGQQANHYRFNVNGQHCYDAVVMPEDFLPDVLKAMREFRTVMAGEHATTVDQTPPEMLDACDLALNVFEPIRHMAHGLPIREWDRKGYQRFLKDYRKGLTVPLEVLALPKDFRHYSIGDVLTPGS